MAFETRKSGDPATAKAPRKRAAARPAAGVPVEAAVPVDAVPAETVPVEAVPSMFGSSRPKRPRPSVSAERPVPEQITEGPHLAVPASAPESAGSFAARGAGRRRTAAATATPATPPASAAPAAALTTVPSVEEPATLIRDDRIAKPSRAAAPVESAPAAAAPAAPATVPPAPAPIAAHSVAAHPVAHPVAGLQTEPDVELDGTHEAVVMTLGGGRYGIPMDAVDEVGRPPSVTRVPGLPAWLAGVANWRGRVLAVLDLRPLLGASQVPLGRNGRLVVCSMDGVTIGLLTEDVEGVVTVEREATEQPLVTLAGQAAQLIAGQVRHARGPIALLDLDAVFALRGQLPRARRAG